MGRQRQAVAAAPVADLAARAALFALAHPAYASRGAGLSHIQTTQGGCLYGMWVMGNDYRNRSRLYGAYPPGYLRRVFALFPDKQRILHVFSGSLTRTQLDEDWLAVNGGPGRLEDDVAGQRSRVWDLPAQVRFDSGACKDAMAAGPDVIGNAQQLAAVLAGQNKNKRTWRGETWQGPWIEEPPSPPVASGYDLVLADPPYTKDDAKRYGQPLPNKRLVIDQIHQVTATGAHLVWLDTAWPMHSKSQWRTCGLIGMVRSTQHRVRLVTIMERVGA